MSVKFENRVRIKHGVRYREGGFELRCDDCVAKNATTVYWPLTEEFWDFTRMIRCRACRLEKERRDARARYRANPAAKLARNAAYQRACREAINTTKRETYRRRKAA